MVMRLMNLIFLTLSLAFSASIAAEDYAKPKNAEALVARVVAAVKAAKQKTFDEIAAKDSKWIDHD